MKKIANRIFSVFMVLVLGIFNLLPFIPMTVVHAEPNNTIRFHLDGATVNGNTITFTNGEASVTAEVSGEGFTFDTHDEEIDLVVNIEDIETIVLTLGESYNSSFMRLELHDHQVLTVNNQNQAIISDLDFSNDNAPHLQLVLGDSNDSTGGINTQNYAGNGTSILDYSINGVIEYTEGNGYDYGIGFTINGIQYKADDSLASFTEDTAYERDEHGDLIYNDENQPIPINDPETNQPMQEKTALSITGDTIHYDYDTESKLVDFVFLMAPGTLITSITINGNPVENIPSTKEELRACYKDHRIEIEANDVPYAEKYIIAITARYPNESEEFMGNFLWDYNPQGYTSPEDKILNGTIELVEAVYDENEAPLTTPKEVNDMGDVFIWKDAERKKVYTEEREGVGEAQFPVGTELTVRIIPDAGYQLVDFGINGGVFEPLDDIGTYKFVVEGGPFHLQATIQQVDDVVKTTSEKIESGNIVLGGEEESMAIGSARLDVKDIDLTEEQINNFEEAANGYEINHYIDISLFNTVYKGNVSQSWDTEVNDLTNDATITLKLEDGVNAEEVVIVHEHEGSYEIIPVEYDAESHTITFKTKSFSNYAIATKGTANPKTGDAIIVSLVTLLLSAMSLIGLSMFLKKKSITNKD